MRFAISLTSKSPYLFPLTWEIEANDDVQAIKAVQFLRRQRIEQDPHVRDYLGWEVRACPGPGRVGYIIHKGQFDVLGRVRPGDHPSIVEDPDNPGKIPF